MSGLAVSGERAVREWRDPLARIGLAAKGVLYFVLGLLAIQFARGETSSGEVSQTGAIEKVAEQPFGKFLLVAMTIGLVALTIWHVIQALTGDPIEGDEPFDKAKFAAKALVYGVLTFTAAKITIDNWSSGGGGQGQSGDEQSRNAASTLFDLPAGTLLVVVLGLVLLGIAAYQVVKYVVHTEHMERIAQSGQAGRVLCTVGRIGYAARATVLAISGVFFLVAAAQHDPRQSKGISGTLQTLADRDWGRLILWGVAIGLVLFGIFCVAEARFRRAA